MKIVIAIDGPAGVGKSTVAKLIAKKFSLMYIDTGAMYRGVTLIAKKNNIKFNETLKLSKLIKTLDIKFLHNKLFINNEDVSEEIRKIEISNSVSLYAAIPEVREILVSIQQQMSKKYNVIMDGRDIGTVVLRDAHFKFYLIASPNIRAMRRFKELKDKNIKINYETILEDIIKRDHLDSTRKVSPLKKAKDAVEIDTSNLTIEEVVSKIEKIIDNKNIR